MPDGALTPLPPAPQVDDEARLVAMWLSRKSVATKRLYSESLDSLRNFTAHRPLRELRAADIFGWSESLAHLAPRSRNRHLAAVRSLYSYGTRLGYFPFNVAAAVDLEPVPSDLARRILEPDDLARLLHAPGLSDRDRLALRLTYACGLRVSEVCRLIWADLAPRGDHGRLTVLGKGGRVRHVKIVGGLWRDLEARRGDPASPIFASRSGGGHLSTSAFARIVKRAAKRAGLPSAVSPHWIRHCTASHAVRRGAPLPAVRDTLGHSSIAVTNVYLHAEGEAGLQDYLAV